MGQRRVLVLCEPGRAGDATLDHAGELARRHDVRLTVVAVAPRAENGPRCGTSAIDYNAAVRSAVAEELDAARGRLAVFGVAVTDQLLIEGEEPSLERFTTEENFDLVLLPARRRWLVRTGRHPAAAILTRVTRAEIRVVEPSHSPHGGV